MTFTAASATASPVRPASASIVAVDIGFLRSGSSIVIVATASSTSYRTAISSSMSGFVGHVIPLSHAMARPRTFRGPDRGGCPWGTAQQPRGYPFAVVVPAPPRSAHAELHLSAVEPRLDRHPRQL